MEVFYQENLGAFPIISRLSCGVWLRRIAWTASYASMYVCMQVGRQQGAAIWRRAEDRGGTREDFLET